MTLAFKSLLKTRLHNRLLTRTASVSVSKSWESSGPSIPFCTPIDPIKKFIWGR